MHRPRLMCGALAVATLALLSPALAAGPDATPATKTSTSTPASTAKSAKVDINSAELPALVALPGIGDALAAAIVAGRPYKTVEELVTKKVLTKAVLDPIRKDLVATAPALKAVLGKDEYGTVELAKAHCPTDTVVWANKSSKIFHFTGYDDFGKTKSGAYMCEKEALAAKLRAAKDEKHP